MTEKPEREHRRTTQFDHNCIIRITPKETVPSYKPVRHGGEWRLKPYAMKVARTVSRGGGTREGLLLLGKVVVKITV